MPYKRPRSYGRPKRARSSNKKGRYSSKKRKVSGSFKKHTKVGGKYANRNYAIVKSVGTTNHRDNLVGGRSRGGMMPAKASALLTYYESVDSNITSATTSFTDWSLRPDSMFDPNSGGIGHQPRGFDQWMTFYVLYRVKKVRITHTITFEKILSTEGDSPEIIVRYSARGIAAAPSTTLDLQEIYENKQDLVRRARLSEVEMTTISKTFTIYPVELVKSVAAARDWDTGWATSGGNPVYESGAVPTFTVTVYRNGTFPNVGYKSEVRMEFDAQFKRQIALAAS